MGSSQTGQSCGGRRERNCETASFVSSGTVTLLTVWPPIGIHYPNAAKIGRQERDVRHPFGANVTTDIPSPNIRRGLNLAVGDWETTRRITRDRLRHQVAGQGDWAYLNWSCLNLKQ